jgi:predicted phage-related endonuclease
MQLQRTDEWYQQRLGKATASRFNDVMTVIRSGEAAARRNYRAELVAERLTGTSMDNYVSKEMQWGIDTEPLARLRYTLDTGNLIEECGFYAHAKLEAGASPDGLLEDNGLVEIKCPNTATHIESLKTQAVPRMYLPQIQGQLWITGRKYADYISFDPRLPENAALFISRVERDEPYIKQLEGAVIEFLAEVDKEVEFVKAYGKKPVKKAQEVKNAPSK